MATRSEEKKQFIVRCARNVFSRMGYTRVTMKDIANEAKISRGGLYLYFTGTADIFSAVLKEDALEDDGVFEMRIRDVTSAGEILRIFLDEQKKELSGKEGTLLRAQLEYALSGEDMGAIREKFEAAVKVLEYLLKLGMQSGEFRRVNPRLHAEHMMYVIEGMKTASGTMHLTEEEIEREFSYLLDDLMTDPVP